MQIRVNLTKRVSVEGKDRYCPVVMSGNGRVKPDWIVVNGKEERYPGGSYYIDWTIDGKRKRISVGTDAAQALTRKLRKETELSAASQGITVVSEDEQDKRRKIATEASGYLDEISLSKKPKTFSAYATALLYFQESCTKIYVDDIERIDMLKYATFLRDKKGLAPRSVRNKFGDVMTFLKTVDKSSIIKKNDWPRFVHADVEIYEKEDLEKFFAACDKDERLCYEFFLMTGMREQEVIYREWPDLNQRSGTVSMKWKPAYNWTPKGYKEREIPIPTSLMASLTSARPKNSKGLIFPTSTGKADWHFLEGCKTIAHRAGLDPDDFWLHKFRATFATWHLWAGVDLRTVQEWMGHTDLASTLRYLRPARGVGVQEKVNATFEVSR